MSWCVLQLAEIESATAVQRAFRTQFHMEPPSRISIYAWYKKFEQKGCICKGKSPGQPSVCRWPPSSPDLIPCDFFLWGYIKDKVFVPCIPQSLPELRQWITSVMASITRDTAQSLGRVGLSSRHLSCDSRRTYRVSVRCVQNFESFSIDWCRCEVLRRRICFLYHF
jgi:hypothetical protein